MNTSINKTSFSGATILSICALPNVSRDVKVQLVNLGCELMRNRLLEGDPDSFLSLCTEAMSGNYTLEQQKIIGRYKDNLEFLLNDHYVAAFDGQPPLPEAPSSKETGKQVTDLLNLINISKPANIEAEQKLLDQLRKGELDNHIRCNLDLEIYLQYENSQDRSYVEQS